jgi:hypothetical protein
VGPKGAAVSPNPGDVTERRFAPLEMMKIARGDFQITRTTGANVVSDEDRSEPRESRRRGLSGGSQRLQQVDLSYPTPAGERLSGTATVFETSE